MKKRKFLALLFGMIVIIGCMLVFENTQQFSVQAADTEDVFEMTKGGSIRVMNPTGLRFQVRVSESVKAKADKVGMLIFPADYLEDNGRRKDIHYDGVEEIAKPEASGHRIDLDLTKKLYKEDGCWYGNGALVNIKEQNMAREFVGIAYYKVDGETFFAEISRIEDTTRSVAQVALLTHADKTSSYSSASKKIFLSYMGYLKAASLDYNAPDRYQTLGYLDNNGLRFYVEQYVDEVIETGDKLTQQTHLEAEILPNDFSNGESSVCCKFWLDGTCEYPKESNIKNIINSVTITPRDVQLSKGYRYKISYEIFIEFKDSVKDASAQVQFKHHLPGESLDGFEYSYKEYKDGNRCLYQDNCNSYEFRANGVVGKDVRYLPTTATYNKELFYQNQGTVQAADPSVITVGDTFYLYATDAEEGYDCTSIRVWSSKNLTDWIEVGQAFRPASDAWAVKNLWAPEVIAANGKYYMYYSGYNHVTGKMGIGVAVSDSPTGPFHEYEEGNYSRTEQPIVFDFPAIDPHPFIDDDGRVYLYYSKDQVEESPGKFVSSIYGCELNGDMVTVNVDNVTTEALVAPGISDAYNNYWNEAPNVYKHSGKYYMIYAAGYYKDKGYCLGLAVSDNPLSGFKKVNYTPILKAQDGGEYISGTGHGDFFPSPDGTEVWLAYHSHVDVENPGDERKINFDKVSFDASGELIISGPTVTPQVLPSGVSDCGNIASKAEVTATNGEGTSFLTDGIVNLNPRIVEQKGTYDYCSTGTNTIKFTLKNTYKITGVMVYADTTAGGRQVEAKVGDSSYTMTLDSSNIPGTASILEIPDKEASEVTLTLTDDVKIKEVVILAKGCWTFSLTTNHFAKTEEGKYILSTDSDDQSRVDDVRYGINSMRAAFYSVKGKLTLTDAGDWGQARILISSDPMNEYFIALEKTDQNKYQIFTMSKDNQGNWDVWQEILSANVNDQKNSIDFEVIADRDKFYFLIDDEICYAADRVSMVESTVKFTGFNHATTTVENINGQFFENSEAVTAYIATKKGYNFGETVGDGVSYTTTDKVDLTNDFGTNATMKMYGEAPRYAYLNNTFTDKFCFETEIKVTDALPDNWPKFGVMLNGKTEMVKFYVDMKPEMIADVVGVVHQRTGEGDDWNNAISAKVNDMKFTGDDTVKLMVVRDGVNYYFYVNDRQVLVGSNLADEKGAVGIFSFNAVLTASNYKIFKDADADDKIAQAKSDATRFFGSANGLQTREDVDLSGDTGANTGIVLVNGIGNTYLYAKNVYQQGYYFETQIHVKDVLNGEQWPKFGLFAEDGAERIHFYVDMTTEKNSNKVGVVHNYDWGTERSENVENMRFSENDDYVRLGLRKEGKTLRFYVNGTEVLNYESSFEGNTTVGVFGFNVGMELKNYFIQ